MTSSAPVSLKTSAEADSSSDPTGPARPELATVRDEDLEEANAEDVILARPEWGSIAMLAAAASFGASAPNAMVRANAETFGTVERYGDFSISNGGGPLGQLTKEEIAARKQEEDNEEWTDWAQDMSAQREKQEREREEWAKAEHEFAGVSLTGEEWGDLSTAISADGALRKRLVSHFMKGGKTQAEAEKRADDMAEIYRIMSKPESQRTPDEQTKVENAERDPEFREATRFIAEQRGKGVVVANEQEQTSMMSGQAISVASGADAFDAGDENQSSMSMQSEPVSPVTCSPETLPV